MFVKRVIEKDVHCCGECPYYSEYSDMGATICLCQAIDNSQNIWANVLRDMNRRKIQHKISQSCPLIKGEE